MISLWIGSTLASAAPADCDDTYRVPDNPLDERDYGGQPAVDTYGTGPSGRDPGGRVVVPTTSGEPKGTFPTAWIVHGIGVGFDEYTVLQERLAHAGIASVSVEHADPDVPGSFDAQGLEDTLLEHMSLLYGSGGTDATPLAAHLDERIALVGHSIGGGYVLRASSAVAGAFGIDLFSVVAMAPNAEEGDPIGRAEAQGLLVILGSDDADDAVNRAYNSGFGAYDESGSPFNEVSFSGGHDERFTKSMVYVEGAEHTSYSDDAGAHQDVVHAYVLSYLLWSLRDDHDQHVFFKQGETLDAATGVQLQWMEPTFRRVLENFEGGSAVYNTLGGSNVFVDVTTEKGAASSVEPESPHHTRVLAVDWSSSGSSIGFGLPAPKVGQTDLRNLMGRRYLSLRVGQDADANGSVDFSVRLRDGSGTQQSHPISAFGTVREPFSGASHTDAAMETILVPLCAYDAIDRSKVLAVELVFDRRGHTSGHIQLDSLEFID
ncbi:MAG: hypothetical protein KTR31_12030 [Myxococcales bacterium]|nr:hypothetical protein [Myxococcales bacterium]